MKKYIFLPGGVMVAGAVVWAALALKWGRVALVVGGGGLLVLALGVAVNWREIRNWFRDPRGVFAVNTAFSTLLVLAILILLNALSALRPMSFDWTQSGRNTLSGETVNILTGLSQDVWLKQFGRTRDPRVDELLNAFSARSQRIQTSLVDAEKSPQETRLYGVLRNGTVVVGSGQKFRKVEKVTEPALATALLQVTSHTDVLVCFATGEGEHGLNDETDQGLSRLVAALNASNYTTDILNLQQRDVPQSCSVLAIAGPQAGLQPAVIGRVESFMAAGGRVALLVDPPVDPNISSWLAKFGFVVGQGVIVETSPQGRSVGAGPETPLALGYASHAITKGFELATIYDRAVPITVTKPQAGKPQPLAATGPQAFERVDLMSQATEFREGRDHRGPLTLAVATTFPRGSKDARLPEARMVVFGDSDFVSNGFIGRQGNRDLAIRVVAWLAGEEEARIVDVADRENRRIELTEQTRMAMYVVNFGLLPLIPLAAGLIQLFRARK